MMLANTNAANLADPNDLLGLGITACSSQMTSSTKAAWYKLHGAQSWDFGALFLGRIAHTSQCWLQLATGDP